MIVNRKAILCGLFVVNFICFSGSAISGEIDLDDIDFSSFVTSTKPLNKQTSKKIDAECEKSAENARKLLHDTFANTGDSDQSYTNNSVIPPFSSCNDMYDKCGALCSGKSNKSPIFSLSLRGSSKEKCEDECAAASSLCDIRAKGGTTYSRINIRFQFCSAICEGNNDIYTCTEKCENNFDYWGW